MEELKDLEVEFTYEGKKYFFLAQIMPSDIERSIQDFSDKVLRPVAERFVNALKYAEPKK